MPLGDKSGPNGQGSLTGRRLGFCTGNNQPGYASDTPGRGKGRGGFRRGAGNGIGMGYGRGYAWNAGYQNQPVNTQDEAGMLKAESQRLESELKAIKKRLDELDK
ncbi:MAG: DUF5320 domain-containing protein [Candidatus Delongbacteria bacterium]|jgi:hypothetical protein|nr:DUF5320 domain-containing protein [Candidatus Delongbacteria bacterium]